MIKNTKKNKIIRTLVQDCTIKTTKIRNILLTRNSLPHGNSHGISLCRGGGQSGNYSLVLSNHHEINLVSEGSYPMEEGIYNIDSHNGSLEIGNDIFY